MKIDHLNPFPYMFKSTYDFKFEENKDKIFQALDHTPEALDYNPNIAVPLEKDGGISTVVLLGAVHENIHTGEKTEFVPPHAWEEFSDFGRVWLPDYLRTIWETLKLEPCTRVVSESWINKHPVDAWTSEHDHHNVVLAVTCYLNVPEDSGRLMVKNPIQMYKYAEPIHHNYWDKSPTTGEDMSWEYIPVKTNDVVVLPGWLRHKTEPNRNKDNQDRIIMSYNIRYAFNQELA